MSKRPSSIDRMDPQVRDWIGRLRDQGRTLDEIIAKLRELDLDALPSRSALHRHLQKAEEVAERIRKSRAVADVIVRRLGESDPDKTTRMNIELMHNVLFEIASRTSDEDGEPVTFEPMEAMLLAKALDHLGKAAKDDVARTVTIEKRAADKARAEALAKTSKAISDATEAGGGQVDGAALLKKIREDIYGITP
jgi:ribosomal protein L14